MRVMPETRFPAQQKRSSDYNSRGLNMRLYRFAFVLVLAALLLAQPAKPPKVQGPWLDKTLPPDQRADLLIAQMTLDEKIQLVHGTGWGAMRPGSPIPPGSNEGAGFVPGIERLGIPAINLADSAVGVRMAAVESRYATLLPSTLAAAASFDPEAAYLYGSVIGRELRDQGSNMSIGGGVDLIREPRNGRNFEYAGEDPILAGIIVGQLMKGLQAQQVMGDIKHYAFNDQETGRNILNVVLDKRAMRETDLLAFQIALKISQAAGVMCAYNKVNGDYSCENDYLLNQVLKKEWGFQGWVLSDWGGTHSTTKAAMNGLDQEMPGEIFFGAPLKKAAVWIPQSMLLDPPRPSFRRVPGMPAEVWFPAIALPGAPLWGFTYRLLVDWLEISSRECAGPGFEVARMTLDFLRSRGLIVLSPWHSTARRNGDELGPAQAAKVSGPIPIDAVIEYFSGLGAYVAKINRIEVRPEYIRIHGVAFEEYLIRSEPADANEIGRARV